MWEIDDVTPDKCNYNCDNLATCACGLVYGDYNCACPKGYSGSGFENECHGEKEFTFCLLSWRAHIVAKHVSIRDQGGRYSSNVGL